MVALPDAAPAASRVTAGKSLMLGGVLGIDAIGHCVALATLAFAGPLSFALGYGTMLILLSSAAISLVLAWRSVFPGAAGIAEDTTIAILAPAMLLAAASIEGTPEQKLATAVAIMGLSTLLSGAAIYLIGKYRLGRIARLMPFPVAAGFLAGSGWLLVASSLFLLTNTGSLSQLFGRIATGGVPLNLIMGIALAAALFLSGRVIGGAFSAVLPLLGAVALFYLGLGWLGLQITDARAWGLLPVMPEEAIAYFPDPGLLTQVQWPVVAAASVTITAVVLLNAVGFMLNVGGIELAVGADISIDAEARTTGATNIAIGAFGGLVGFVASDTTVIAHRLGCSRRLLGLGLGLTTLIGCIFAAYIVAHVPVFVAAGLLLYFGTTMLIDWMIQSRARLRPLDWAIIPTIVGITIVADILAAIVVGMLLALVIFVYNYARLPVIRFQGSGLNRRSPVDRASDEDAVISRFGGRVHVMALQGYLFFGSVEKVIDAVRLRTREREPLEVLVIDFTHVTGIDSAACAALLKLGLLGRSGGFRVVLSAVPAEMRELMAQWGIGLPSDSVFRHKSSLGSALERVEDKLLASHGKHEISAVAQGFLHRLESAMPRAADLVARMERLELEPGRVLIRAGSTEGDVFFVETGRVDVQIPGPGGTPTRVRSLRAGAVVGEAARYLSRVRTADVVVRAPSVVYRLSDAAIELMEREDRDLAAILHAYMARSLAEKVEKTNGLLSAALR
ncbi:MAG: hypothetical protein DI533_03685 [Cereibacter sphaeroides]|uniref:Cyclic nucleotide-binding domain-containing protein n=1 Tax=Cereibacter sphaeroides TaxID=1063 RepID=A0A2W5SCH8_CERSP|nr:MAG: hypothetical protein DI533_03685 [Cereibacter sphaeroides]